VLLSPAPLLELLELELFFVLEIIIVDAEDDAEAESVALLDEEEAEGLGLLVSLEFVPITAGGIVKV
jgi:hypothetical protein